jgi:hypothetical protein
MPAMRLNLSDRDIVRIRPVRSVDARQDADTVDD